MTHFGCYDRHISDMSVSNNSFFFVFVLCSFFFLDSFFFSLFLSSSCLFFLLLLLLFLLLLSSASSPPFLLLGARLSGNDHLTMGELTPPEQWALIAARNASFSGHFERSGIWVEMAPKMRHP